MLSPPAPPPNGSTWRVGVQALARLRHVSELQHAQKHVNRAKSGRTASLATTRLCRLVPGARCGVPRIRWSMATSHTTTRLGTGVGFNRWIGQSSACAVANSSGPVAGGNKVRPWCTGAHARGAQVWRNNHGQRTSLGKFLVVVETADTASENAPSVKAVAALLALAPKNTHSLVALGMSDGCVAWLYGCEVRKPGAWQSVV